ncbi:dihydroxyacetone kinase subunit DhaK [Yersinia mollaretii]|uniref:dihydroxyacetone kinase subunit DhaK n=1 Tax=Yersinia mollaretii TaxID=33060 RepID=UPI0011A87140|nr:dihydroxyacetone kinase subunit DhaK [Yersinia mollaretii]
MNRIINDPDHVVEDAIKGYLAAYPHFFAKTDHEKVLKHPKAPYKGKVGVVTGGGSGHEPAFLGYIGKNMLDAVAVGEIFSSPAAGAFLAAFKAADGGAGVACLYGNYAGDNMNVKMAAKKAQALGIKVKTVVANDDVASAPPTEKEKRRGVAGEIFMWKVGAAAAAQDYELDAVIDVAQKAIDNCRSVGVGLTSCTIPAVGKPNFHIEDGMMEVGIGHHGEPGIRVEPLQTADQIAKTMVDIVVGDVPFGDGDEVAVLISGLGATPTLELYIYYAEVVTLLKEKRINIYRPYIGNHFTSLDMMGITLTLMKLDDELKALIDVPTHSLGLTQVE